MSKEIAAKKHLHVNARLRGKGIEKDIAELKALSTTRDAIYLKGTKKTFINLKNNHNISQVKQSEETKPSSKHTLPP